MQNSTLKTLVANGAIWAFIVLELIFFQVAGSYLSLSDSAFMDLDNMLLLLKQSAPIGIIAIGMTVIMINGNIDLSVGAIYALAGIVMLDSMNWPFMEAMGDGAIPLAWLFALFTGCLLGLINGVIVWKTHHGPAVSLGQQDLYRRDPQQHRNDSLQQDFSRTDCH